MRSAMLIMLLASTATADSAGKLKEVDGIYKQIDDRWPNLGKDEYNKLIDRADLLLHAGADEDVDVMQRSAQYAAFEPRYKRCKTAWDHAQQAFDAIDEGVGMLTSNRYTAGSDADQKFDEAVRMLGWALRDAKAGTPDSCGDGRSFTHAVLDEKLTFSLDRWIEKAKQLDGLAEARSPGKPAPARDAITQAPRATVAAAPGLLPAKYIDNPQYGCGSLDAWQKTATRERPAGDPSLLPGCSKLDDASEGGATLQQLSQAKKLVAELDKIDRDGNDSDSDARLMKAKLDELRQVLESPAWKSPELDPLAMSFERLYLWEQNELKAMASRSDIHNQMVPFWQYYDQKSGKFNGHYYDVFASNVEKCLKLVDDAKADGVDLTATVTTTPERKSISYLEARKICAAAQKGMAAKKQADAEAAAAEDKKWKEQCGGDKYKLWKAHGEYALSRGGWDQSRPEQACKADVWFAHHGPDDRGYYDCDKYTFSGNKQTAHQTKSTRFHMVCP